MKKALIIITFAITGCVYSPRNDRSTHYHGRSSIIDDAPFYDNGMRTSKTNYTPTPHPVNRSIYFIERSY
jgi:hypothetical protein